MNEASWKGAAAAVLAMVAAGAGCAVPQGQNTPVPERKELDPVSGRDFWIYVPSTYTHAEPMPLVITCHGTPPYDVAHHHIREWKKLGEDNGCIVVAPSLKGTGGLIGDGPIVGMYDCERVILSLLSFLSYRYNIDRANVMLTGFSGGGFPTYWVGLRHPDLFNCVVPRNANFNAGNLDGWWPPQARSLNVLVYYGANDPAAIKAQSQRGIQYLRANGFAVETAFIPGAVHERHPEVAMEFFRKQWRNPQPTYRPSETQPHLAGTQRPRGAVGGS